jgi:Family of unknown function (DUF6165)
MSVRIEVATAELIDKITILEIKQTQLADPAKRRNVEHELGLLLACLDAAIPDQTALAPLRQALKQVNERIWGTEDDIRDHERRQDFGASFIRLARAVYHDNDERARLKRQINELLDSTIVEEKSYSPY